MGERKGQNKYYPPDFDPKKHKSLNGYHGTHALRERARKLDQGILIIRFEMPYNIWCEGCKAHIAMGVRYNAEKKKVGMYFSTPIHEFRMKCHLCDQHFEIRTDPKNLDYVIMSGARRKEQRWDMGENEQIVTDEKSDIKRLSIDPMFSLEHEANDKGKLVKLMPTLRELEEAKSDWKDDYALNSMMRNILRGEKKVINEQKSSDQKFLDKWNINIDLVRENEEDVKLASLYKFNTVSEDKDNDENKTEKRKNLETESIFDSSAKKLSTQKSTKEEDSKLSIKNLDPKQSKIDNLRKKLNKSVQKEKIISTGFNFTNSNDKQLSLNNKLNSSLIVVKKNNNQNSLEKPEENLNISKESSSNLNKSSSNPLVSNDYGSSSDEN